MRALSTVRSISKWPNFPLGVHVRKEQNAWGIEVHLGRWGITILYVEILAGCTLCALYYINDLDLFEKTSEFL